KNEICVKLLNSQADLSSGSGAASATSNCTSLLSSILRRFETELKHGVELQPPAPKKNRLDGSSNHAEVDHVEEDIEPILQGGIGSVVVGCEHNLLQQDSTTKMNKLQGGA
ncbi:unnamed protein product, partial [Amoebophrya sp. A120]